LKALKLCTDGGSMFLGSRSPANNGRIRGFALVALAMEHALNATFICQVLRTTTIRGRMYMRGAQGTEFTFAVDGFARIVGFNEVPARAKVVPEYFFSAHGYNAGKRTWNI